MQLLKPHVALLTDEGLTESNTAQEIWRPKDLEMLDRDGVLEHNWLEQWQLARTNQDYRTLCEEIAYCGGPILEVAAGPGGGNLSPVLHINGQSSVVVNDIDPRILKRWSNFLQSACPEAQVSFAAFDICASPFRDESFDCVSSAGGLGTMQGSHQEALRECARILKPQGMVACLEMVIAEACLKSMPEELVQALVYHPWLFRQWREMFAAAGMQVVRDTVVEERLLCPETSALASDAMEYQVSLIVEFRAIVARKG